MFLSKTMPKLQYNIYQIKNLAKFYLANIFIILHQIQLINGTIVSKATPLDPLIMMYLS